MTPAEERERFRERLRRHILRGGLHQFVRSVWPVVEPGVPFSDGKHIALICAHLEAVTRGEIDNLIINQPPGTSKSSIVSVIWPVWDWLVSAPGDRFMFATFDESLAVRDSEKSRNLVNSTWFRILFGDLCGHAPGTCKHPRLLHSRHDKSRDRSDTLGVWYNSSGGLRFSTTVQSKATGWHAHKQVIDDPLKPQEVLGGSGADTRNALTRVVNWFSGTMSTRKADPGNFRRVIVMQRLHDGDLVGHLLRTQPGRWVHLNLPMEFDPARAYRSRWGDDWRTVKGELLCPARFSPEAVAELKRDMGPILYSAQCQQDPIPEGGGLIQEAWIPLHEETAESLELRGGIAVHSWDCAFKDLASSDSVAGGVVYYVPSEDCFYLVDAVNDRLSFVETIAAIEHWATRDVTITDHLIEDKANGPAVMNVLANTVSGMIPVTPLGSKESRVISCTPVFARKGFKVKANQPWTDETVKQLVRFPKYGSDDMVDVITQAIGYFLQSSGGSWVKYMGEQFKFSGKARGKRK